MPSNADLPPAPFIVGVPHSGTTLLRLQLDAHPDLAIAVADRGLAAGLRAYYQSYAADRGKTRYGGETPGHVAHMRVIERLLPEARFIHVIRDGRDVAASRRGLRFAPGDGGIVAIAAEWRDTIWRARQAAAGLSHYVEVRYERLAAEPEPVLRELCAFLELPFDETMLRAHEPAATRPAWQEALSDHDVTRFERFAGGALTRERYPPYRHAGSPATEVSADAARTPAMKVVLGRQSLAAYGGTETYALTVARELERLGHDVTLAAEDLGIAADVARTRGIRVARMDELPAGCDAVIAHDLPMATTLAERYPNAQRVYVSHADGSDLQLPPLVPGLVDAVVACSDRMAARVRALPLDVPIFRLHEPIDTDGHVQPKALPDRPRRALIVSNYLQGGRRRALVDAWEDAGVECVQVGAPNDLVVDLGPELAAADILVGKARAALEGMCAGCAVYIYDQYGGDGWVTPETYPAFEADHFAGQATARPRTEADLAADLGGYSPEMGLWNNEVARTHHGARHHAIELVAVLRGSYLREPDRAEVVAEVARLARATGRAELRMRDLWEQMKAAEQRAAHAQWQAEQRAAHAEERAASAEERAASAEERAGSAEERAAEAERRAGDADYLLATKRVRAGLALGHAVDRLRSRA